jgi:hypothetical protein
MMTLSDAAGYVASAMVMLTFLTKDMRLLRVLAILSNIAFVTYGLLVWLPPVFCLHLLLLPINTVRLREMLTTSNSSLPLVRPRPLNGRRRSTPVGCMDCCAADEVVSIRLDVGRPDHFAPLLSFRNDKFSKIGGRH